MTSKMYVGRGRMEMQDIFVLLRYRLLEGTSELLLSKAEWSSE